MGLLTNMAPWPLPHAASLSCLILPYFPWNLFQTLPPLPEGCVRSEQVSLLSPVLLYVWKCLPKLPYSIRQLRGEAPVHDSYERVTRGNTYEVFAPLESS